MNDCAELLHLLVRRLAQNDGPCGQVDRNRSSLCGERERDVTKTSICAEFGLHSAASVSDVELAELQLSTCTNKRSGNYFTAARDMWRLPHGFKEVRYKTVQNVPPNSKSRFQAEVEGKKHNSNIQLI